MSPEMLISISAFAAIGCGVWAVLSLLTGNKSRAAERLGLPDRFLHALGSILTA